LGCFSGAGFAGQDHHLVLTDGLQNFLAMFRDGQFSGVIRLRQARDPFFKPPAGALNPLQHAVQRLIHRLTPLQFALNF